MADHQSLRSNQKEILQEPELKSIPGYVKPRIKAIEKRIQSRAAPESQQQTDVADASNNDVGASVPTATLPSHGSNSFNMTTPQKTHDVPSSDFTSLPPTGIETPSSAISESRFHFLSSNPGSNIKQFESEALRRQAQYHARISDLEGRLAIFHARLATEAAERGREHAYTMEEMIDRPLEEAMKRSLERIEKDFVRPIMDPARASSANTSFSQIREEEIEHGEDHRPPSDNANTSDRSSEEKKDNDNPNEATSRPLPNLVSMERRVNHLEARMTHHQHVTLFQSKRHHFDSVEHQFLHTLQPSLTLETAKADKREGGMVRRFESSAGEYSRMVAELEASRVASLGYIQKEIESSKEMDRTRAESFLERIRELKNMVIMEKEERERQDSLIVDKMIYTREMLEEKILSMPAGY